MDDRVGSGPDGHFHHHRGHRHLAAVDLSGVLEMLRVHGSRFAARGWAMPTEHCLENRPISRVRCPRSVRSSRLDIGRATDSGLRTPDSGLTPFSSVSVRARLRLDCSEDSAKRRRMTHPALCHRPQGGFAIRQANAYLHPYRRASAHGVCSLNAEYCSLNTEYGSGA